MCYNSLINFKKIKIAASVTLFSLLFVAMAPNLHEGVLANAESLYGPDAGGYPYDQTFAITAYYSPLPCQDRYVTGSYEGDIRLNGSGVNSADGTPVYPGMIAAPKNYAFGTKMYIPGIGIVAVHDRGGAIVTAGNRGQYHDRLDIWMGYGDPGLQRALEWGKRTVDVTVYGITDSVVEDVYLGDYDPAEKAGNKCYPEAKSLYGPQDEEEPVVEAPQVASDVPEVVVSVKENGPFSYSLGEGSGGDDGGTGVQL